MTPCRRQPPRCGGKCLPVPNDLWCHHVALSLKYWQKSFSAAVSSVACPWSQVDRNGSVAAFLDVAETLVDPINAFFDNVFVMTEEADVRTNRQALLRCA